MRFPNLAVLLLIEKSFMMAVGKHNHHHILSIITNFTLPMPYNVQIQSNFLNGL